MSNFQRPDLKQVTTGDRVVFIEDGQPKHGVVRWTGVLQDFPDQLMVGINYDFPLGRTNGTYRGRSLFTAKENHGAFVPRSSLILEREFYGAGRAPQRAAKAANGMGIRVEPPSIVNNNGQISLGNAQQQNDVTRSVREVVQQKEKLAGSPKQEGFVDFVFMRSHNKELMGPYKVSVQPTMSISSLKNTVAKQFGDSPEQQVWVVDHKIADNNEILGNLGVWNTNRTSRPCLFILPNAAAAERPAAPSVPAPAPRTIQNINLQVTVACGGTCKTFCIRIPASKSKMDLRQMIMSKTDYIPNFDDWMVNGRKTECDGRSFLSCGIQNDSVIVIPCRMRPPPNETGAIPKVPATNQNLTMVNSANNGSKLPEKKVTPQTVYNVIVRVQNETVQDSFKIMINRHTKYSEMQSKVFMDYGILPDFQQWTVNNCVVQNAKPDDPVQKFGTYEDCVMFVCKFETGWSCPACTLINPVTRPGCRECCTDRPEDFVLPRNVLIDDMERERLQKEAEADLALREEEEKERRERGRNYVELINLDDAPVVINTDQFECGICMEDTQPGEGVVLRECLHSFCQGCLQDTIRYCDDPYIKCPYNADFSCDAILQFREVQSLVPEDVFEKLLWKSLKVAESTSGNSFHCCTPNCNAWCEYDDDVNQFNCPLCRAVNCITCRTIHHPKTCKQYQDWAELHGESRDSVEAVKSKDFLRGVLENGTAMRCPGCRLVIIEKTGCDWVSCTNCRMEICWATKGPRWGPKGHGDTTGGCRCGVNGQRCRPNCGNCH